jgi:hypothetical protein
VEGQENRRLVEAGPETGGLPRLELPGGTHRLICAVRVKSGGSKPGRLVRYHQDTYGCPRLRVPGRYVPVSPCL